MLFAPPSGHLALFKKGKDNRLANPAIPYYYTHFHAKVKPELGMKFKLPPLNVAAYSIFFRLIFAHFSLSLDLCEPKNV